MKSHALNLIVDFTARPIGRSRRSSIIEACALAAGEVAESAIKDPEIGRVVVVTVIVSDPPPVKKEDPAGEPDREAGR